MNSTSKKPARDDVDARIREAQVEIYRCDLEALERLGNWLAKEHKYQTLRGIEAVHLYLVNRHHWTPAQVRAMTPGDLAFCVDDLRRVKSGRPSDSASQARTAAD